MSDLMDKAVINMPYEMAMCDSLSRMQFHSRAQSILRERDTYRDMCVELLDDLKSQVAAFAYAMGKKSLADSDELITKAEKLLGENNAT